MGKVMDSWRLKMASSKTTVDEAKFDVMYSTGFANIDYINGTMVHVRTPDICLDYESIGIVDGTSNTIISRPGSGKSTLCTQILGNLLKQFPDSDCYIDDIENSLPMPRKEFLLGLSKQDINNRVFIRNTGITTENVYEMIRMINDTKLQNRADYEYDSGVYDTDGNRIFKLIPTFYFIDSFAMLLPNDVNEDTDMEGSKNAAMSVAKKSTWFIKKIGQMLKASNIVLFTINHILDDVQMGPFTKPVQVEGLKQGERLPGGRTSLYLANNMFRIDKRSALKETEAFGIQATIVDFTICKSRTNTNLRKIPLLFDKSRGLFDNVLSTFLYLKEEGLIGGAGRSMYIDGYPEIKFSQKSFKETLANNRELQIAFAKTSHNALSKLLSDTSAESAISGEFDLSAEIMNLAA